jgi:hypothetical protein
MGQDQEPVPQAETADSASAPDASPPRIPTAENDERLNAEVLKALAQLAREQGLQRAHLTACDMIGLGLRFILDVWGPTQARHDLEPFAEVLDAAIKFQGMTRVQGQTDELSLENKSCIIPSATELVKRWLEPCQPKRRPFLSAGRIGTKRATPG